MKAFLIASMEIFAEMEQNCKCVCTGNSKCFPMMTAICMFLDVDNIMFCGIPLSSLSIAKWLLKHDRLTCIEKNLGDKKDYLLLTITPSLPFRWLPSQGPTSLSNYALF
jgi:hypothetical protein